MQERTRRRRVGTGRERRTWQSNGLRRNRNGKCGLAVRPSGGEGGAHDVSASHPLPFLCGRGPSEPPDWAGRLRKGRLPPEDGRAGGQTGTAERAAAPRQRLPDGEGKTPAQTPQVQTPTAPVFRVGEAAPLAPPHSAPGARSMPVGSSAGSASFPESRPSSADPPRRLPRLTANHRAARRLPRGLPPEPPRGQRHRAPGTWQREPGAESPEPAGAAAGRGRGRSGVSGPGARGGGAGRGIRARAGPERGGGGAALRWKRRPRALSRSRRQQRQPQPQPGRRCRSALPPPGPT